MKETPDPAQEHGADLRVAFRPRAHSRRPYRPSLRGSKKQESNGFVHLSGRLRPRGGCSHREIARSSRRAPPAQSERKQVVLRVRRPGSTTCEPCGSAGRCGNRRQRARSLRDHASDRGRPQLRLPDDPNAAGVLRRLRRPMKEKCEPEHGNRAAHLVRVAQSAAGSLVLHAASPSSRPASRPTSPCLARRAMRLR